MLLPLLLVATTFATAQTILPTVPDATFPACALTCAVLLSAQTICLPPDAPVTDQFVYDQCFCQSSLIASLYTTPDQVCTAECPVETDRQLLQSFYINFCAQVAQTIVPTVAGGAATSSISTDTSTVAQLTSTSISAADSSTTVNGQPTTLVTLPSQSVVVVTVTSTNTAPIASSSQSSSGASAAQGAKSNGSWIDNHWKWVLMLGILILGLGLIAWLAVFLKRRHVRKQEEREAAASGFPQMQQRRGSNRTSTATLEDMFGPHQHQHMTNGFQYTRDQSKALGAVGALGRTIREKSRERRRERIAKTKPQHALTAALRATEGDTNRDGDSVRSMRSMSQRDLKTKGVNQRSNSLPPRRPGERGTGKINKRPGSSREFRRYIERDVDAIEKG